MGQRWGRSRFSSTYTIAVTFLSPWTALLAAAVALPLLILLYFLKLRRQPMRIASTLLWEKSFQDLQVNAPFQRLRWSVLLLLQLLLLIALLLALSEPLWRDGSGANAGRIVLLIDRSASMNARDIDPKGTTRLEAAKAAARDIINNLSRSSRSTQAMVVAFGASAQVVSGFESSRQVLIDAVNSIVGTDEEANLEAALQLAGAFASRRDESPQQSPPEVVLISDGTVGSPREASFFRLRSGSFRSVPVGPPPPATWDASGPTVDNVGIVSFSARRDYHDPAAVQVFARLLNAGNAPVEVVLTLSVGDKPATIVRRVIPAATEIAPGEESVQTSLDHSGGAILSLRHNHADSLDADDAAWLVLPPPSRPRIVIVHPDDASVDPYLNNLVNELDPQRLDVLSKSAYEARDALQVDAGAVWDLVIFDRVSAGRLPGVPTLTFGAAPAGVRITPESEGAGGGKHILSWDRQHPLMRNVALDTIVFAGLANLDLAEGATPLAFGPQGPVIALIRGKNARHVVVGFNLARSNWPLHVSIAVFMQNVMDYLLGGAGTTGVVSRPGDPMTVRAAAGSRELSIDGPLNAIIPAAPGSNVTLPALRLAGVYTVIGAAPPMDRLAVSMLSDVESDIRPRSEVLVNADSAAQARAANEGGRELWPWLIAAAFVLLVIEWLVYCFRVR